MILNEIMKPFTVFFDWMKTFEFYIGEYPLTFWDLFVWSLFAGIVIDIIVKLKNG